MHHDTLTYAELVGIIREIESLRQQMHTLTRKMEDEGKLEDKETALSINPKWWVYADNRLTQWVRRLSKVFPDEPIPLDVTIASSDEEED